MNRVSKQILWAFVLHFEVGKLSFKLRLDLKNFPKGSCGIASELLGGYLREHGIKSTYVCGWKYSSKSNESSQLHAWLIVDGLIVDITVD